MSKTIRNKLKERLLSYPNSPVFLFRENDLDTVQTINTKDFYDEVSLLGGELINRGYVKKNIAIYGENSYAWVLAYFAIVASGNSAVLLDYNLSENELSELITFTDCVCVLYSATYEDIAFALTKKINIPFYETKAFLKEIPSKSIQNDIKLFESANVEENDLAEIAFSSGTFGKTKGVMLSNLNVYSNVESVVKKLHSDLPGLQILPLYHTYGLLNLLEHFFGNISCFIENSLRNLAKDTATYIFRNISAVPAILPTLYNSYKDNPNAKWVRILCGGAPEDKTMFKKLNEIGVEIYNGYGLTECSPCVAIGDNLNGINDTSMSIIDVNTVTIDNPDENGIGEVLVSGDNVMLGYYKMPEETKKTFKNGKLLTGDLGKIDQNGRLILTGRKQNVIVLSNGEKISPEQVEQKVRLISGVSECYLSCENGLVVLSIWAPQGDKNYIKTKIIELNRSFSSSKRIAKIVFSETPFVVNSIGKIKRKN